MWIVLKWIIFIAICVLDVVGEVMSKINHYRTQELTGVTGVANIFGFLLGVAARLYILYILHTRWLTV